MKAQGVITVPVQNGKVTKTGKQKNNNSTGNADFMAVMNELSAFGKNQNTDGPSVKKDTSSKTDTVSATKTSFRSTDMKFKSSYVKDSDSHIISNTAKTSDNSTKSTAAKTQKTDSSTASADKATKDGSTVQNGKETDNTQKTDKTGNTNKTDSVNRDTGVSGPETEDITVDEEETVEDFSSDILERIKEDLGADDATVLSAMQSLGFSFSDLTVQSNAAQLYMTITGADQSDLLTSDDFMTFLNDLQSDFSEIPQDALSQMTPVTDEEAQELMSYLNDEMTDEEMTADGTVIEDDLSDFTSMNVETEDVFGEEDDDTIETVEEQPQITDDNPTDTTVSGQTEDTDTGVTTGSMQPERIDSQNSASDMTDSSDLFGNSQKQPETQEINTNAMQADVETAAVTENSFSETISQVTKYTDINTDNVIQQIVDKAKQTLGTTVKSLEMELNPQSLGKIYLQVAEKSGDVTAHLYAQNEAVKHALENRLADLQDNLNKQGIKVNEVTISVEPHAFERNFEQNANGNLMNNGNAGAFSQRETNAGTVQKTPGTIDVREGFDGTQTVEDELEASIMRDNGNTVSYLA